MRAHFDEEENVNKFVALMQLARFSAIMAAHFTRTIFLIKEMIIYTRVFQYLAIKWVLSRVRQLLLTFKWVYLPKLFKKRPVAEVYLALNDPYSFMLVQVLDELKQRFDLNIKLYLTHGALISFVENKKLWRQWALKDANSIADIYQLKTIERYPSSQALATGQQMWQLLPTSIESAQLIFEKTWQDDFDEYYLPSTPVITHQIKNLARLVDKGHELTASIYCLGEWFWGIDSLEHLERRLNAHRFNLTTPELKYIKANLEIAQTRPDEVAPVLTEHTPAQDVITAYVSLRSPFSYLGFMQAKQLSQQYQKPLKVKLLLPLLMRGVELSTNKQRYLYLDAYREAKLRNIPFAGFAEPLGAGILNSYQLFAYIEQQGKANAYIQALFEAVFLKNISLAKESNLKKICVEIGIDYQQAKTYGIERNWQAQSDLNQQQLTEMGYWGVPCFHFQNQHCWGQDRLWLIQQQLEHSLVVADTKESCSH
ncbi:DsbA family protein [Thalassotalea sp. PLHSN55]|uniref:DsbA family protein n=1 Tax=Thalassotalea sp. PLHSN55 TaxID=3435888 RepID=UPI003F86D1EC